MLTNEQLDAIIDRNNLLAPKPTPFAPTQTTQPTQGLRGAALWQSLTPTPTVTPTQISPSIPVEKPGFFGRLRRRFGEAIEEKEFIAKKEDEDKINKVAEFIGKAGVDAEVIAETAFDTVFSGIKGLVKIFLTKEQEKTVEGLAIKAGQKFIQSETGKSVLEIIEAGQQEFEKLERTNPSIAETVKGLARVAELAPTGKAFKLAKKPIRPLARKGAGILERQLTKQVSRESLDIIKPKLSDKEIINALEIGAGRKKGIIPGLRKIETAPTLKDFEIANTVKDIVSTRKNFVDNIKSVRNEIGILARQTDEGLKSNDAIFNNTQLRSFLDKVKDESRVIFGTDKTLENNYDSVINEMFRIQATKKNRISDLLQTRKDFDSVIKKKFPNIFDRGSTDIVRTNAVMDVRRGVNDFIEELLPDGNEFKPLLKRQSNMYIAVKNIAKKNAEVVNMDAAAKVMRFLRQNPITHGLTGGIITFGALGSILSSPILLGSAAILGVIKVGERIITSKSIKQGLIKILRAIDSGKVKAPSEIRAGFKEVINSL